jgi:hypothetical protein
VTEDVNRADIESRTETEIIRKRRIPNLIRDTTIRKGATIGLRVYGELTF